MFLVLESRANAEARGASIYATLASVEGDRGPRDDGRLERRLRHLADATGATSADRPVVFSGASGLRHITAEEHRLLAELFPSAPVRGFAGVTGHLIEPAFPLGVALAALALKSGAKVPPFDPAGEAAMDAPASSAIVTTLGHVRGEGIAVLAAEGR